MANFLLGAFTPQVLSFYEEESGFPMPDLAVVVNAKPVCVYAESLVPVQVKAVRVSLKLHTSQPYLEPQEGQAPPPEVGTCARPVVDRRPPHPIFPPAFRIGPRARAQCSTNCPRRCGRPWPSSACARASGASTA